MKKLSFLLCITLLSLSVYAQNFEGKITYQYTYKSKQKQITDQQLLLSLGSSIDYYVKNGNYKSVSNGLNFQWNLYTTKENKIYQKFANTEAVLWIDASYNTDKVLKTEIKRGVETIAGYLCDELTVTCRSGKQKFYFNSKIGVDPKLYAKHQTNNLYEIYSKTNAIPLKYILDNDVFTMEGLAADIIETPVDDATFELPANVKLKKLN